MIAKFVTDSPAALAAIAEPKLKNVWIHGSVTYVYTDKDYVPPVVPVP
ncbi:hypothetical protein UFOVP92_31 [uncultured Caudovirales phage]|uniref:Uncharacterized protein n=1 Tax=uncultured Caudovirales phage TaxID=2100421 RepID=A0A6J5KY98_9CAUD|nr:hypothetical protein UFOVP92_31 [uncultured Caudovirales phage]